MSKTFRIRWKAAMRKAAASIFFAGLAVLAAPSAPLAFGQQTASLSDEGEYYTATNLNTNLNRMQEPVVSEQPALESNITPQNYSPFAVSFALPEDLGALDAQHYPNAAPASQRLDPTYSATPTTVITGYEQAIARSTRDVGSLMYESPQTTAMSFFRRNANTNTWVRGYNSNMLQTQMNGQMWYQARPDQDTITSKIDSGLVSNVVVVPGPFSVLYGPGAAFIDIATMPTMRSPDGELISQYRTVLNYDTNGQGYYGREVVDLGGADYGFRANVGFRHADDYRAGNGEQFNASYTWRDIDLLFSRDLADGSLFEFQYLRLDMTDVELYAQPFNMDFAVTNGFMTRYQTENSGLADHLNVEGWYNQTQIGQGQGTAVFFDFDPANIGADLAFQGIQQTYGNSFGGRSIATYGDVESDNTKVGVDFRGIKNRIDETDTAFYPNPTPPPEFDFTSPDFGGRRQLPNSEWLNPGLLAQREVIDDCFSIRYGGRYDYVQANPGEYPPGPIGFGATPTQRNFDLLAGFASADYHLNDVWVATSSLGHGQRAPTNFELFTDRLFVAGYQHGFTIFQGNPNLDEERITQGDLQLTGEFADARFMVRGFYSYVDNFVTVRWAPQLLTVGGPLINGYQFVNSDSEFKGVEFNAAYDVTQRISVFANGSYTHGTDIGQFGGPVFGVYPFQSRTGVRFEEMTEDNGYGVELSARLVAQQDRVADTDRGIFAPFEREQVTPGFQTLDLRGFYRANRGLLLTSGVTNLADQAYLEHFDYRNGVGTAQNTSGRVLQPGRNFYFGMEWIY